jgi:hypothetical protein
LPFQRQPNDIGLFPALPSSAAVRGEGDDSVFISATLPEAVGMIPSSALGLGIRASDRQALHYPRFSLLVFVLLVHVCGFLLICLLWHPQLSPFGLTAADSRPKVTALKAYFVYAPAVEINEVEPASTEVANKSAKTQSVSGEEAPKVTAKKPTNTANVTEVKPQLEAKNTPAEEGENAVTASSSVSLFTQQYFERQREQALDDLVIEQADKFTRKSNMSEMSPEMEVLFVPNADDLSGPTSLDFPLDPNRIIRKGDTCYRVVQVGTQINPYAENLGFPFNCSGKEMNQAIEDAIQARLNKMGVKPYK